MTTLQHGRSSYGNRSNGPNIPMCCVTSLLVISVGRPASKAKPVVRVLILDEALFKNKRKGLEDLGLTLMPLPIHTMLSGTLAKDLQLQHNTLLDVLMPRMSDFEFPRQR